MVVSLRRGVQPLKTQGRREEAHEAVDDARWWKRGTTDGVSSWWKLVVEEDKHTEVGGGGDASQVCGSNTADEPACCFSSGVIRKVPPMTVNRLENSNEDVPRVYLGRLVYSTIARSLGEDDFTRAFGCPLSWSTRQPAPPFYQFCLSSFRISPFQNELAFQFLA